ncbi:MFS transporter [Streptomyces solincola]|uniref:MFS transporter n=1 Tax=Streptomyces solincola TaxID=2100817 RepID=UPI0015E2CDBC|nr:MFS transporter [Streptomyces solincola]
MAPSTGSRARFGRRDRLALLAAASAALVVELDWLAVNVALPKIAEDVGRPVTDLQWLISAFTLAFGSGMPVAGWVIDAFGRRRTTIHGLALFALGSLLCACAPSLALLVSGRVVQGIAGAFIVPGAIAMTAGGFTGRRREVGLGVVMAAASGAAAFAPFVGGALVSGFGWRSVFVGVLPVCLVSAALIHWCVTPSFDPDAAARRPPLLNGGCVVFGAVLLTLTVDRGPTWGWSSAATLLCAIGGFALLVGFALLERSDKPPLLDRSLYRDRPLRLLTLAGAISVVGFVIVSTFVTWDLQEAMGLSPFVAGCTLLAFSFPNAAAAYGAGRLAGRSGAWGWLATALAVAGAGALAVSLAPFPTAYSLTLALCGTGIGLSGALCTVLTQQRVPTPQAGAVASLTLAFKYLAAAIATSLAATLLEGLRGSTEGAAADRGGIDTVLRGVAVLTAAGVLLALPDALRAARRGGRRAGGPGGRAEHRSGSPETGRKP